MRHLTRAIELARQTKKLFRVQICAILANKRRIVAVGFPRAKTSPLQNKYKKNPHAVFIHAEIDAIARASRNLTDLSGLSLYLARVDFRGNPLPVCPCSGCAKALAAFNITRVHTT